MVKWLEDKIIRSNHPVRIVVAGSAISGLAVCGLFALMPILNWSPKPKPSASADCTAHYVAVLDNSTSYFSVELNPPDTWRSEKGRWDVYVSSIDSDFKSHFYSDNVCNALDEALARIEAYNAYVNKRE